MTPDKTTASFIRNQIRPNVCGLKGKAPQNNVNREGVPDKGVEGLGTKTSFNSPIFEDLNFREWKTERQQNAKKRQKSQNNKINVVICMYY